jgi:hypothetical protein
MFFLIVTSLLTVSRLLLGEDGLIELPLLGALDVYAIAYLVRPSRFQITSAQSLHLVA